MCCLLFEFLQISSYPSLIQLINMEIKNLSDKGIERFMKLENNIVLQVLGPVKHTGAGSNLLKVTISDGYALIRDVLVPPEARNAVPGYQKSDFINYVIKIKSSKNIGRDEKSIYVISEFEVLNEELEDKIGNPIPYEDFKKNGNKNSTNFIPQKKKVVPAQKKIEQPKNKRSASKDRSPERSNSNSKEPVVKKKQKQKATKKAVEPIHKKLSPQKQEGPIQYTDIEELMIDQIGWTILVRLTSKSQPRPFVGKKGASTLMNLEFMDRKKASIQGVVFGDSATKLYDTLETNEIYEVSGGNVEMTKGPGGQVGKQKQIVFNDKSVFKFYQGKEGKNIPYLEDLAIKITDLIDKEANQEKGWDIIGIIKEQRKLEHLKTKAGKDMSKKIIVICDPDEKIQIPVTLFFKLAEQQYNDGVYYFKGVSVGQYLSKKQFSMSFKSSITPFPNYRFKNRRGIDEIDFKMGVEQTSNSSRKVTSIKKILEDEEKVTESASVWNTVRCYVNVVKTSGTLWYMGCPECKKKVIEDGPFKCIKCLKNYPKPKYYYILNLQIQDWSSSIWVTFYDEVAKVVLNGLQADSAKNMELEEFKDIAKSIKNKEIEAVVQSRRENYEGNYRIKHTVMKLIPIDFSERAKEYLKSIHEYITFDG